MRWPSHRSLTSQWLLAVVILTGMGIEASGGEITIYRVPGLERFRPARLSVGFFPGRTTILVPSVIAPACSASPSTRTSRILVRSGGNDETVILWGCSELLLHYTGLTLPPRSQRPCPNGQHPRL